MPNGENHSGLKGALMAARLLSRAAALCLMAMMLLNVVDVSLRSTINAPIYGTYEIVELLLAAVAFLAIPETFLRGGHVEIELIDQMVSERTVARLKLLGLLLSLVFFLLLVWYMVPPVMDLIRFEEVTVDLHLPLVWRSIPPLLAVTAAALAIAVRLWVDLQHYRGAYS